MTKSPRANSTDYYSCYVKRDKSTCFFLKVILPKKHSKFDRKIQEWTSGSSGYCPSSLNTFAMWTWIRKPIFHNTKKTKSFFIFSLNFPVYPVITTCIALIADLEKFTWKRVVIKFKGRFLENASKNRHPSNSQSQVWSISLGRYYAKIARKPWILPNPKFGRTIDCKFVTRTWNFKNLNFSTIQNQALSALLLVVSRVVVMLPLILVNLTPRETFV